MKKQSIKQIALCACFTAIISATAIISIPLAGVNLTMQSFGVALCGFLLGAKRASASVIAYIAIGAAGLPVFSAFTGGIGVLLGASGGFLWGFVLMAILCGISLNSNKKPIKTLLMLLSVILCHTVGVIQYSFVVGVDIWAAFVAASLPFIAKDFAVVFLADFIAKKLKSRKII